MANLFNSIQLKRPKSNYFDLTHDVKMTTNMGSLIPICVMDAVPGDKFKIDAESIIRFAPMLAPIMHRIDVSMHYFFVPNRILWPNWENFITNQDGDYVAPYFEFAPDNIDQLPLLDYMGVNAGGGYGAEKISALPFAAYQKIYNEYYRDQNLVPKVLDVLEDGNNNQVTNAIELLTMRNRAWEHDYFTASLPFAQKGNAVDIPLGNISGDAGVFYDNTLGGTSTTLTGSGIDPVVDAATPTGSIGSADMFAKTSDLSIEPTTINDLRRAFKLQEWLEKNARGGTRYIEQILTHFGVKSSDSRLQRPEYITGMKTPVVISEVLNTTGNAGELPQGNMAGHGISVTGGNAGMYRVEEHGYIIGIMSVMPKTAYMQGIPKHFLRFDKLDYFWPSFANIGEQEVKNRELFSFQVDSDETFGYVPRYAEYKYVPSRVAGDFKTNLDYWHLGRKFANPPQLNKEFIECTNQETDRIFAVTDPTEQKLYCHVLNKVSAIRLMPKFGTPMI